MGCVSSTLFNHDDDFPQIGSSSAFSHHIVSLTSTTYGLLTLDPPPASSSPETAVSTVPPTPPPPPRVTLGSLFPSPLSEPRPLKFEHPQVINSWELMAGLDPNTPTSNRSFRFSPSLASNVDYSLRFSPFSLTHFPFKENSNPNAPFPACSLNECSIPKQSGTFDPVELPRKSSVSNKHVTLEGFEKLCPPNGESKVVVYTTTLRGVRQTFEACNTVRSAIEALGILICERDISMDKGFREELRKLMKGKGSGELIPPRVFVRGRYIGGVKELMSMVEDGYLGALLQGLPRKKPGQICEGCGGLRFLPCFTCNGSCKVLTLAKEQLGPNQGNDTVVRCADCNENGLVLCPICS